MGLNVTDMGLEKKEHKRELKKHAATIHCSNTLSLLQRKITNALLFHAYKELMLKEEHIITVKQLCRLIGYHGNNHAVIREAFKGLISTVIEWNLINDVSGTENWTASSILASVSLEGPLCYYAYSPRMKQLLHSPSMFGKIDLVIQSKFRSSYGLALYENCIRYRGLPHTKWFDMELFKKLMGVPVGKYDVFRDFKRRVLDKAIDEVNMYSDLIITPDYIREGRRVVRVRFKLKERAKRTRLGNKTPLTQPLLIHENDELKTKLFSVFAFTAEQVDEIMTAYDAQFILEKVKMVEESKAFQQGKIKNIAAYLISAIKNNYQAPKEKVAEVVKFPDAVQEIEMTEVKRIVEIIRQDYTAYREQEITEVLGSLDKEREAAFMHAFYLFAEPAINVILQIQRNKYSRDNILESPQIKAQLRQFAMRELDILSVMPIEEFVAQCDEVKRDAWQKLKSMDPDHYLLRYTE